MDGYFSLGRDWPVSRAPCLSRSHTNSSSKQDKTACLKSERSPRTKTCVGDVLRAALCWLQMEGWLYCGGLHSAGILVVLLLSQVPA